MALEGPAWIGVDGDVDRLAWAHQIELGFLEIRGYPDLARHKHHQRLADCRVAAFGGGELGHTARHRRDDYRARKVGYRLFEGSACLRQLTIGEVALGLQNGDLFVGCNRVGSCRRLCWPAAGTVRPVVARMSALPAPAPPGFWLDRPSPVARRSGRSDCRRSLAPG